MSLCDFQQPWANQACAVLTHHKYYLDESGPHTGKRYVAAWIAKRLHLSLFIIASSSTHRAWSRALEHHQVSCAHFATWSAVNQDLLDRLRVEAQEKILVVFDHPLNWAWYRFQRSHRTAQHEALYRQRSGKVMYEMMNFIHDSTTLRAAFLCDRMSERDYRLLNDLFDIVPDVDQVVSVDEKEMRQ